MSLATRNISLSKLKKSHVDEMSLGTQNKCGSLHRVHGCILCSLCHHSCYWKMLYKRKKLQNLSNDKSLGLSKGFLFSARHCSSCFSNGECYIHYHKTHAKASKINRFF